MVYVIKGLGFEASGIYRASACVELFADPLSGIRGSGAHPVPSEAPGHRPRIHRNWAFFLAVIHHRLPVRV